MPPISKALLDDSRSRPTGHCSLGMRMTLLAQDSYGMVGNHA